MVSLDPEPQVSAIVRLARQVAKRTHFMIILQYTPEWYFLNNIKISAETKDIEKKKWEKNLNIYAKNVNLEK